MIQIKTSRAILLNAFKKFKYSISPGNYILKETKRDEETWLVLSGKKREHIGLPLSEWIRIPNRIQPLNDEAKKIFSSPSD